MSSVLNKLHIGLCGLWDALRSARLVGLQKDGMAKDVAAQYVENISVGVGSEYKIAVAAELAALSCAVEVNEAYAKAREAERAGKRRADQPPEQVGWNGTPETSLSFALPKDKVKTRSAVEQVTEVLENVRLQEPTANHEFIAVSRNSLQLLHRLSAPQAISRSTASERWDDFVTALLDAGCTTRHNSGSAVTFSYGTESLSYGVVVFHRPHPDPTINPVMLGAFGKQPSRRLGWSLETYVEREKGSETR